MASLGLFILFGPQQTMADPIAHLHHDFRGQHQLFSYAASPKEQIGQAEVLAKKVYGNLVSNVKSPKTMFMCTWRPDIASRIKPVKPQEIFLACNFSTEPFESPSSLVKLSELYNKVDRSNLKAIWKQAGKGYELTRFEVEIRTDRKTFRSIHRGEELSQIVVSQADMIFPEDAKQPFKFRLQATLPERYNSGDKLGEPVVAVTFQGKAEPIPKWANY